MPLELPVTSATFFRSCMYILTIKSKDINWQVTTS
jgi:hypothetical protein